MFDADVDQSEATDQKLIARAGRTNIHSSGAITSIHSASNLASSWLIRPEFGLTIVVNHSLDLERSCGSWSWEADRCGQSGSRQPDLVHQRFTSSVVGFEQFLSPDSAKTGYHSNPLHNNLAFSIIDGF
jgi:hypothetical protein